MQATDQNTDVLIVGAGMAGVMAAVELQRVGFRVLVLDKGRGVGGRMSSRRVGGATFDHGAQFIAARDPRFAAVLERERRDGSVEPWFRGSKGGVDGPMHWRGRPAMSAVPGHLALGLDIQLETSVMAVRGEGNCWRAETATGRSITAGAVVLTPPVPQSLAILEAGGVTLSPQLYGRLAAIDYDRCLAVLVVLEEPSRIPPPGGLTLAAGPIRWIADNQLKGISVEPAVTLHATPAFSLEHWDHDRDQVGRILLDAARPWVAGGIKTFQVHGWRYSQPRRFDEEPCVAVSDAPALLLAGDAFGGPGVEGAARSGWAAAEAILGRCRAFRGSAAA